MAVFKCKMCGADLNVSEGVSVIECEYCGTKQTVSCSDDEKRINLYNRANRLRINSEFDKAANIYESIVAEFPEEAEAYWGLVICNYGIEYVDDPATAKKIPTCHRASFESIQNDENYQMALEYADVVAQKVYRDEAREIDRIREEILSISKNEKPYDIFICYKETDDKGERTIDSVIAQDVYDALTDKGYKVFFSRISLEDKLGRQYEPYIFAALNSAKIMLSFGTKYEYFHAAWVRNEWSRFLKLMAKDKSKVLIPCYKDMDAYDLPEEFKALQAQDMGKIGFMQDLIRGIGKINNQPNFVADSVKNNADTMQLMLNNGVMYEGQTFANIPHGFGKATYKDNSVYEGNWERGKRHGHGKIIWNDGSEWCGEFSEDKACNGKGVYYFDGKIRYEGEIVKGFRSGLGRCFYENSVYEGEFVNNNRHGMGKVLWNSGGEWQGEFKNDKFWSGEGSYYYADSIYTGKIINGKRHGHGKIIWNNGGEWVGEFNQDEFCNGEGVYYYDDSTYHGRLVNGKRHGHGKMIWNDGGEWVGEFYKDNFRKGTGIIYFVDGSVKQTNNGGCYVATCVYGSYDCPQVWMLRRYRDQTLAKSWHGRIFVKFYYSISPTIVKWFGETKWFKKLWRCVLDRKVLKLKAKGFNDTPYDDMRW